MAQPDYELFNRNWSIYQKVIRGDYMRHQTIGGMAADVFRTLEGTPAEMIDLGCGDAQEIARQARLFPVKSFTGFDLSAMALQIARKNLDYLPDLSLRCEPLESVSEEPDHSVNFVFSGYAIHHLEDSVKKDVLKDIYRVLRPGGHFLLADVFRKHGKSRQEYMDHYFAMVKSEWTDLSADDVHEVIDHIRTSDYPADSEQFIGWVKDAGFELISSDTNDEQHLIYRFRKSDY